MERNEGADAHWRMHLSEKTYRALKYGDKEEPNTGRYVHTRKDGTYLCAGCGSPVFSSRNKIDDGSGYAAFRTVAEDDEYVTFSRVYGTEGTSMTYAVCRVCDGKLGQVSDDMVRSATDLEEGNHERVAHVNSNAVTYKKGLTLKNYPVQSILLLLALITVAYFSWAWTSSFTDVARHENLTGTIHLWVGDEELFATPYHLDAIDPNNQSLVVGSEAIFIVLPRNEGAPGLRLSNQPVDVLWLDDFFRIVKVEHIDLSDEESAFSPPTEAAFVLVTRAGKLPPSSMQQGAEVFVVDKTKLF